MLTFPYNLQQGKFDPLRGAFHGVKGYLARALRPSEQAGISLNFLPRKRLFRERLQQAFLIVRKLCESQTVTASKMLLFPPIFHSREEFLQKDTFAALCMPRKRGGAGNLVSHFSFGRKFSFSACLSGTQGPSHKEVTN